MAAFIKGKELCRGFFEQVAKPILDRGFPGLVYSAGLLGYGSDVLGYDDVVSTDHMWGPRFYLFLREEDKALQPHILEAFSQEFPYTYRGYSVHFSRPDPNDKGIRHAEAITQGQVDPLIFFHTFEEYLDFYLGTHHPETLADVEWLSLPEHHLLPWPRESFTWTCSTAKSGWSPCGSTRRTCGCTWLPPAGLWWPRSRPLSSAAPLWGTAWARPWCAGALPNG